MVLTVIDRFDRLVNGLTGHRPGWTGEGPLGTRTDSLKLLGSFKNERSGSGSRRTDRSNERSGYDRKRTDRSKEWTGHGPKTKTTHSYGTHFNNLEGYGIGKQGTPVNQPKKCCCMKEPTIRL